MDFSSWYEIGVQPVSSQCHGCFWHSTLFICGQYARAGMVEIARPFLNSHGRPQAVTAIVTVVAVGTISGKARLPMCTWWVEAGCLLGSIQQTAGE